VLACAEQHFGEVPASDRLAQVAPRSRRRKRKPGVQKGGLVVTEQTEISACAGDHRVAVGRRDHPAQSKRERTTMPRLATTTRYQRDAKQETTDEQGHPPVVVAPFGG